MSYGKQLQAVLDKEIAALQATRDAVGGSLDAIIDALAACSGKVVFSGIGKSGYIARKIASTFSSLGTPSVFLHPAEAPHGDLGMLCGGDVAVLVSNSGESVEVVRLADCLRARRIPVVALTGNPCSALVRAADLSYCFPPLEEASVYGYAPTASTTALLAVGDALAVVLSEIKGFDKEQFAALHPGGYLGECLCQS